MRISSQRIPMTISVWTHGIVFQRRIEILDIQHIKSLNSCLQSPLICPPLIATEKLRCPEFIQHKLTIKFIFPSDIPTKISTDQNIVRTTQRSFNTSEKYHRHEIMPLQLMFPVEHHRFEQPQMCPIPQSDLQHMHRHVFFG